MAGSRGTRGFGRLNQKMSGIKGLSHAKEYTKITESATIVGDNTGLKRLASSTGAKANIVRDTKISVGGVGESFLDHISYENGIAHWMINLPITTTTSLDIVLSYDFVRHHDAPSTMPLLGTHRTQAREQIGSATPLAKLASIATAQQMEKKILLAGIGSHLKSSTRPTCTFEALSPEKNNVGFLGTGKDEEENEDDPPSSIFSAALLLVNEQNVCVGGDSKAQLEAWIVSGSRHEMPITEHLVTGQIF